MRTIKLEFRDFVKTIFFSDCDPRPDQIVDVMMYVKMTERSKAIVVMYLSTSATLKDIADMHGISRERVRQIVVEAYRRATKYWR